MSRIRATRKAAGQQAIRRHEWPAIVYMWTIGLAIVGYAVGRVVLDGQPHPYHWLVALVAGLAGIPLGWLWFRWRGDVF